MTELERSRHAEERGLILKVLTQEYGGRMTRVAQLAGALDLLGAPMTQESLQFSLQYLADEGYVLLQRAADAPGFRRDRMAAVNPDVIVWCKITPKGIRLVDGDEPANAGVRF